VRSFAARASECNKEETVKLLFQLFDFLKVSPRLPDNHKVQATPDILDINAEMSREDILEYISAKSGNSEVALLSLYAYRQMDKIDWKPFVKTALERNPVALDGLKGKTADLAYQLLLAMPGDSMSRRVMRTPEASTRTFFEMIFINRVSQMGG
jgi:hypothetical protein